MRIKPVQNSRVELLASNIHSTAVTSIWYVPQNYSSRVVGTNPFRVLWGNIVVGQSMYQKNWNATSNHRPFGGGICQVDTTCKPAVEKCRFDCGSQGHSAQPCSRMKHLPHEHVRNLPEAGERRFGNHRTEAILRFYGLKQNGGTHRFTHSKNTFRTLLALQPIKPSVHVTALPDAVGWEIATTLTLSTRVG